MIMMMIRKNDDDDGDDGGGGGDAYIDHHVGHDGIDDDLGRTTTTRTKHSIAFREE